MIKLIETLVNKRLNENSVSYDDVTTKMNKIYNKFSKITDRLEVLTNGKAYMVESGIPPKTLSELADIMIQFTVDCSYKLAEAES